MAIVKRHLAFFNQLRQFFLRNGHCYVPSSDADLFEWTQRIKQSRPSLSNELVEELESMSFDWMMYGSNDLRWQSKYYELKLFKNKTGRVRVNYKDEEVGSLKSWIATQRLRENRMPDYQKKLLNEIGFKWSADLRREEEERWMKNYQLLVAHHQKHGNVIFNSRQNKNICNWMSGQRALYAKDKLSDEKIKLLEQLGFDWEGKGHNREHWQSCYQQLVNFKAKYGHLKLPNNKEYESLMFWTIRQRKLYRENTLSPYRQKQLKKIGFCWDLWEGNWQELYEQLKDFWQKHGHFCVPAKYDKELFAWISTQRLLKNKGKLDASREKLLEEINFEWDGNDFVEQLREEKWQAKFEEYQRYLIKKEKGEITKEYPIELIYSWVAVQRYRYRKNILAPERYKLLSEIGFIWDVTIQKKQVEESHWQRMFEKFKLFVVENGHGWIETKHPNRELCNWAAIQRKHYKKNILKPERYQLLTAAGFIWKGRNHEKRQRAADWQQMFQKFKRFVAENGHGWIKKNCPDRELARWARMQKLRHKNNNLDPTHYKLLTEAGFIWRKHKKSA